MIDAWRTPTEQDKQRAEELRIYKLQENARTQHTIYLLKELEKYIVKDAVLEPKKLVLPVIAALLAALTAIEQATQRELTRNEIIALLESFVKEANQVQLLDSNEGGKGK